MVGTLVRAGQAPARGWRRSGQIRYNSGLDVVPGSIAVRLLLLAATAAAVSVPAAAAEPTAGPVSPPPLTWLRGEGNFTKASRTERQIDRIVVHSTEGGFHGAVSWLQNPRARASAHFVVARDGGIVQLVHLSDVAWHAGNRKMNRRSIGIELVGWAGSPRGFTHAQYLAAARLGAWLAARYGFPLDRRHLVEHAEVPDPLAPGRYGGRSNHTDPGRYWRWDTYLRLARAFAAGPCRCASSPWAQPTGAVSPAGSPGRPT
jgi:hypothetical protein